MAKPRQKLSKRGQARRDLIRVCIKHGEATPKVKQARGSRRDLIRVCIKRGEAAPKNKEARRPKTKCPPPIYILVYPNILRLFREEGGGGHMDAPIFELSCKCN